MGFVVALSLWKVVCRCLSPLRRFFRGFAVGFADGFQQADMVSTPLFRSSFHNVENHDSGLSHKDISNPFHKRRLLIHRVFHTMWKTSSHSRPLFVASPLRIRQNLRHFGVKIDDIMS
jgi:hypothetical protein